MTAQVQHGAPVPHVHTRLSQLDGLRGIAALIIMLYHHSIVYRTGGPFSRGYLLVDMFFLVSGFVIAVSTEKKLNAGIGAFEFAWARFKRLWPLVAVGAGVAAAWALFSGSWAPAALAIALALDLAMIPSLAGTGPFYRLNGPQWTLFYELLVNFLHALLLRRVQTRWLPLLAAVFGVGLIYTVSLHGTDTLGVDALTRDTWWMPLPRVGWSYVMGVWMGRVYKDGFRTPGLPWQLALALPVAGLMTVPYLPLSVVQGDLVVPLLFLPVVIWVVAMSRMPASIAPALDWLGSYSLPLYCVHLTVLVALTTFGRTELWVRVAAIVASLAVAYVFHRLISFQAPPTQVKAPKSSQA